MILREANLIRLSKNNDPEVLKYTTGSKKTIKWICEVCGKDFLTNPYNYFRGKTKCNQSVCRYYPKNKKDSLESIKNRNIILEWSENNSYTPRFYSKQSTFNAEWKCLDCKNIWKQKIYARVNGSSCPYCVGKKVKPGFNDFASKYKALISEWSDENILKLSEITPNSNKKIVWICSKCGEKEIVKAFKKAQVGKNCQKCRRNHSSLEKEVLEFINNRFNEEIVINDRSILDGKEIDIFFPEMRKGIEINGNYWHSKRFFNNPEERHRNKMLIAKSKGVDLVYVWESDWKNSKEKIEENLVKFINGENYDKKHLECLQKYDINF